MPRELSNRKTPLKTIQAAKKRLEQRKAAEAAAKQTAEQQDSGDARPDATKSERVLPEPRDQWNFTDPGSRGAGKCKWVLLQQLGQDGLRQSPGSPRRS